MNIVAIIQARCNSTRLKNKVLADIDGKPLIERVVSRMQQVDIIDKIVVATTVNASDDRLVDWCKHERIDFFRGSESNVLERYYNCAKAYDANIIVRITADDPFKDSVIVSHAINLLIENNYDYVSNTIKPTYPEGIDIEVCRFKSLEIAFRKATLNSEKEHVTPYIWKNDKKFSLFNFEYKENLSNLRWTIDYIEDLEFSRAIYRKMRNKKEHFLMEDILCLLDEYPELSNIQKSVVRNEGYIESIKED